MCLGAKWNKIQELVDKGFLHGLSIGSGKGDIKSQWKTLDVREDLDKLDYQCNLMELPLPIDNNVFDVIKGKDILEHIPHTHCYCSTTTPSKFYWNWLESIKTGDNRYLIMYKVNPFIAIIEELYRITRRNGYWFFQFPVRNSDTDIGDPTHSRIVHPDMFNHWKPGHPRYDSSFKTIAKLDILEQDTDKRNRMVLIQVIK